MSPWAELQAQFAHALRCPERPIPAGCVGPDGQPDLMRFAVYRNNVASGLIECLAESYPAVRRLLGEDCFREVARLYAAEYLPDSPVLIEYGAGMAEFLGRFASLAALPYLADVARIERAWLEAYHAAEAPPLGREELAAVPLERAADLRLVLHPSVRVVRSRFAALSIWHMNIAGRDVAPVSLAAGGENALLARPEADVQVRALPPESARFLEALAAGAPLARAAEHACNTCANFNLSDHLAALLEGGLVTAVRLNGCRS